MLQEMLPDLAQIGYEIEPFGNNTFVIQGTPADVEVGNEKASIELLLEQFKHFSSNVQFSKREKLIRCMSRQMAIKAGRTLSQIEMKSLVDELSHCTTPQVTASGAPTYVHYSDDQLMQLFSK
jgi:DNA mismatch repair protein MutL